MLRIAAAAFFLAVAIHGSPMSYLQERQNEQPVLKKDFPDPSIVQGDDGTWWAFATAGGGFRIQMASAPSPSGPWTYQNKDALSGVGQWSSGNAIWAPDVRKVGDGWVLYYAAEKSGGGSHCIGAAKSSTVSGPYSPLANALVCDTSKGGAIDPSGFQDDDGTHWITWKVDGNNIGHGGNCNNGVAPIVSTPIMLQQVEADGVTLIGSVVQILDHNDSDGPLVEAPDIIKVNGVYFLFYSSNCYSGPNYSSSYATATSLKGPYTRGSKPLLTSGKYGLSSPGGATATIDGKSLVFHANCDGVGGSGRCLFERPLTISGRTAST